MEGRTETLHTLTLNGKNGSLPPKCPLSESSPPIPKKVQSSLIRGIYSHCLLSEYPTAKDSIT